MVRYFSSGFNPLMLFERSLTTNDFYTELQNTTSNFIMIIEILFNRKFKMFENKGLYIRILLFNLFRHIDNVK